MIDFTMPVTINASINSIKVHYDNLDKLHLNNDIDAAIIVPFIKDFHSLCHDYMVYLLKDDPNIYKEPSRKPKRDPRNIPLQLVTFGSMVNILSRMNLGNGLSVQMKEFNTFRGNIHHPKPRYPETLQISTSELRLMIVIACRFLASLTPLRLGNIDKEVKGIITKMNDVADDIVTRINEL